MGKRVIAAMCSAAVLIMTAGAASAGSTPAQASAAAGGLSSYVSPAKWGKCAHGIASRFRCASVRVPLDYADPSGQAISLELMELPASGPKKERIGSLFLNFGGPGGPDISDLTARWDTVFSSAIRSRFSLVTWDPRGIEYSTPVNCFTTAAADEEYYDDLPVFPYPTSGTAEFFSLNAELGADCEQQTGPLLSHISTADTARDLNLIRQDLSIKRLNYLGYSYGTVLGATFANLFPNDVRSMVLDGTVDFKGNADGPTWATAKKEPIDVRNGVDKAGEYVFNRFLTLCKRAGTRKCAFAAGGHLTRKWDTLLNRARNGKLSFQYLMIDAYYDLESPLGDWAGLARQLQDYYTDTSSGASLTPAQARGLAARADAAAAGNVDGAAAAGIPAAGTPAASHANPGTAAAYTANRADALYSIQCADSLVPASDADYTADAATEGTKYPGFGRLITYDAMPCATWPTMHTDAYDGPWDKSKTTILVINAIYDPITPIWGAEAAVRELKHARLLKINGDGHTSMYVEPSTCRDNAELAYLQTGKLPATGKVCAVSELPFGLNP